jgi:hypothetical protein
MADFAGDAFNIDPFKSGSPGWGKLPDPVPQTAAINKTLDTYNFNHCTDKIHILFIY